MSDADCSNLNNTNFQMKETFRKNFNLTGHASYYVTLKNKISFVDSIPIMRYRRIEIIVQAVK